VIGNPPYVRQESLGEYKKYFEQSYNVYHGVADLYSYFIEKGMTLLRFDGKFGYIVANKWMRTNYGTPLRKWLLDQRIDRLIDFNDLPVFKNATTYPCILLMSKNKPLDSIKVAQVTTLSFMDLDSHVNENLQQQKISDMTEDNWSFFKQGESDILNKLQINSIPVENYVNKKVFRGLITGLNSAFVIDGARFNQLIAEDPRSKELIKPFLLGREVKRYITPTTLNYLIIMPRGWTRKEMKAGRREISTQQAWNWLQKHYPAIANHLLPFREEAEKRYDKGEYWWELRACDYYDEFLKPKIVYPNICKQPEFTFDNNGLFTNQKCFIIPINDLYLLGILNSKVMLFLFKMNLPKLRGGFFEPSYVFFKNFPIHFIDDSNTIEIQQKNRVVELVLQMLALQKQLSTANTPNEKVMLQRQIDATDAQIDGLVYRLYGLTEEEIKIVEG